MDLCRLMPNQFLKSKSTVAENILVVVAHVSGNVVQKNIDGNSKFGKFIRSIACQSQ